LTQIFLSTPIDDGQPAKNHQALDRIAREASLSIPQVLLWQVACETLAWLRRRQYERRLTDHQVNLTIRGLMAGFPLITPKPATFEIALDLKSRYSLSHWDSLLIAACIDAGVDTLYSEDMSHEATYDTLRVVNPFAVS
jgi:predicted nucleic acid-binding protein